MTTSWQTKHVWKRFCAWYGADVVERKFGTQAPEDWSAVINGIARDRLEIVLADVRAKHPTWPPNLFEFEQLAKPRSSGPNPIEVLDAYVKQHYPDRCANLRWIGPDRNAISGVHVDGVGMILLKDIQGQSP